MAVNAPEFNRPIEMIGARCTAVLAAYRLVKIVASGSDLYVDYPAAQFAWTFGATRHATTTIGDMVDVIWQGIALVQVDGAAANLVPGDSITAHNTSGYGQKAAGGAAATRPCVGISLGTSTTDNDVIPVLLSQHGVYFAS